MSRSFGSMLKCESHPNAFLVEDHRAGDMVCCECGLVVGDRIIDVGSEWRTFANSDKESVDMCRVGAVEDPTLGGSDLTTSIGRVTGSAGLDENGKPIYRNRFMESAVEKARRVANRELNDMGDRLSVDKSIINTAQHLYNSVQKSKMVKGRSNNAILAACIYIACNNESVPRTFKEICAVSNSSKKDIARCFKMIKSEVETNYTSTTPTDLISRFCSKLNLNRMVQKLASHIVEKASGLQAINGRSPITVASAAIFVTTELIAKHKDPAQVRSLDDISKVCGAAVTTIKQICKQMQAHLTTILPDEYLALVNSNATPNGATIGGKKVLAPLINTRLSSSKLTPLS